MQCLFNPPNPGPLANARKDPTQLFGWRTSMALLGLGALNLGTSRRGRKKKKKGRKGLKTSVCSVFNPQSSTSTYQPSQRRANQQSHLAPRNLPPHPTPLNFFQFLPLTTFTMVYPSTGSAKVDGVVENIAAHAPSKPTGVDLYSRFALAGAICCSVTHGALTPVDVYVESSQLPRVCLHTHGWKGNLPGPL